MKKPRNYWCYRIDTNNINFFAEELQKGRLRQGWGTHEGQNLRHFTVDEGARRNFAIFERVKKGDILLVPRLPSWNKVAIVEATEDFDTGYQFDISAQHGDYGHIFPARLITSFSRQHALVSGDIRATLRTPSRFWNINHYGSDIDTLLQSADEDLTTKTNEKNRLEISIREAFYNVFDQQKFDDVLHKKLMDGFQSAEWEMALVHGLKTLFPFYHIERVGGTAEKKHGTDVLIKLPNPFDDKPFAIAVQVKDYSGLVSNQVISQINKSDDFFNQENQNVHLIDKVVIFTKAHRDNNIELVERATQENNIKIIFAKDLKELLTKVGMKFMGLNPLLDE